MFWRSLGLIHKLASPSLLCCEHVQSLVSATRRPQFLKEESLADRGLILSRMLLDLNCLHCLAVGVLLKEALTLRVCRSF